MKDRAELAERLATRLKDERASKGLSLDALSKLSGVSRSMLSQIERGESSPTVAILWNLTRALNIDFSTLLDQSAQSSQPILEVLTAHNTPVIRNHEADCEIRILSSVDAVGETEVYDIRFGQDATLDSAPHETGTIEHLTVLEGSLLVTSADQTVTASLGDTIRYRADLAHTIRALAPSRALLIVKASLDA
ncbi:helix-turn-helix domain-containing protein [Albirhodobacter sp. R86504]|jgi:transcriptional regulator with XRE-family HTH domain|uniref:helix-turn-helix domain-containing protein n=1 Tax=Albirhodobacter sp. R86504 TaxID=3093848 RepID=UPI00367269D7